ncbi:hypothetical protein PUNSTDRAFT_133473 [Punctularia strigosozonata HHB-11173 SS5]|uniref:uncharacterized protein n=1 Tax=Punctularia strigosozonata (strain HHB-11173) TaxID=741275 RepID=UPI0004416ACA|nr:uncharacterized protein PUNSTDRAFT_133473 [Punctularia strigosozonata HHB-11173 SS5]EIN09698.1 hypothetical protein PUNSTDRAFT_133473 [Punctularia strigosozonata HHB-11173 SS5]
MEQEACRAAERRISDLAASVEKLIKVVESQSAEIATLKQDLREGSSRSSVRERLHEVSYVKDDVSTSNQAVSSPIPGTLRQRDDDACSQHHDTSTAQPFVLASGRSAGRRACASVAPPSQFISPTSSLGQTLERKLKQLEDAMLTMDKAGAAAVRPNVKPEPPTVYDGRDDLDAFQRYVEESVEYLIDGMISRERHVAKIGHFLEEEAQMFVKRVVKQPERWSVHQFFNELFNYCFPDGFLNAIRDRWQNCQQLESSVKVYAATMEGLWDDLGDEISPRQFVQRFWNGLSDAISRELYMDRLHPDISTYEEVLESAIVAERAINNSLHAREWSEESDTESEPNTMSENELQEHMKYGLCFNCHQKGHIRRNCPDDRNQESSECDEDDTPASTASYAIAYVNMYDDAVTTSMNGCDTGPQMQDVLQCGLISYGMFDDKRQVAEGELDIALSQLQVDDLALSERQLGCCDEFMKYLEPCVFTTDAACDEHDDHGSRPTLVYLDNVRAVRLELSVFVVGPRWFGDSVAGLTDTLDETPPSHLSPYVWNIRIDEMVIAIGMLQPPGGAPCGDIVGQISGKESDTSTSVDFPSVPSFDVFNASIDAPSGTPEGGTVESIRTVHLWYSDLTRGYLSLRPTVIFEEVKGRRILNIAYASVQTTAWCNDADIVHETSLVVVNPELLTLDAITKSAKRLHDHASTPLPNIDGITYQGEDHLGYVFAGGIRVRKVLVDPQPGGRIYVVLGFPGCSVTFLKVSKFESLKISSKIVRTFNHCQSSRHSFPLLDTTFAYPSIRRVPTLIKPPSETKSDSCVLLCDIERIIEPPKERVPATFIEYAPPVRGYLFGLAHDSNGGIYGIYGKPAGIHQHTQSSHNGSPTGLLDRITTSSPFDSSHGIQPHSEAAANEPRSLSYHPEATHPAYIAAFGRSDLTK